MYIYEKRGIWKHFDFIIIDAIMIALSFVLSFYFRHGKLLLPVLYRQVLSVIMTTFVLLVLLTRMYSGILYRGYMKEAVSVVQLNTFLLLGTLFFLFFTQEGETYSRKALAGFYVLNIALMYLFRNIWKKIVRNRYYKSDNKRKWLLITETGKGESLTGRISNFKRKDIEIADVIHINETDQEAIEEYLKSHIIDEVLISVTTERKEQLESLVVRLIAAGLTVHLDIDMIPANMPNPTIQSIEGMMLLSGSMKVADPIPVLCKRLMDIAGAIVGLIIMGIASIVIVPMIKLESPGPALFSQIRVGKNGRKFRLYKFRSMYMDAEERKKELMEKNKMSGFMFKMDDDPRITKIGKFIRKTSIDELPQFWNVLKGDMSLVGTRPPTEDEYCQYELLHKRRLSIKPGITGLWQVSGRSDITDFEQVVELDTKYIMEWSLAEDIRILFKTVKIVFGGKGAV